MNLCGILDHFGYKAPDFLFIHESIWYDLGCFEDWLIDRRGLNLGDVVPFRSRRLPGPTFPESDESQTSASEEEPFISASSTTSKAALLPENLNGSKWEPSSSKATAGSDLAISSIEKLAGIESFMAPLTKEVIEKADALLKAWEDVSSLTSASTPIHSWLEKTSSVPPLSITEVHHPLSSSPDTDVSGAQLSSQEIVINGLPMRKVKEEPLFPKSGHPTQLSSTFTATSTEADCLDLEEQRKTPSPLQNPQPMVPTASKAAPRKLKPKVRSLSILRSALEVPLDIKLLAGGKKPKATSTPQNLVVWYNPRCCHLGGLPTGSIEMKELKSSPGLSLKEKKPSK